MNKLMVPVALAALCGLALVSPALAKRIAPMPPGFRAAAGDAVVVGKVTDVTAKAEKIDQFKGDTREMKVATVKVDSALLGKAGKTIKVGFPTPPPGGVRPGRPGRFPMVNLTKGQEACLILTKHPTKKDVYLVNSTDDVIDKAGNTEWKANLDEIKKTAKVLTNPMAALKSKNAEERLDAAAVLIHRYKSPTLSNDKTEAVPAAESKLILNALAEADWNARRTNFQATPLNLFYRLAVAENEGWKQPTDFNQTAPLAKKWLKDNAGKYKMTRYVREKLTTQASEEPE